MKKVTLAIVLLIVSISAYSEIGETVKYSFKKSGMTVNGKPSTVDEAVKVFRSNPKVQNEMCIEYGASFSLVEEFTSKIGKDGPSFSMGKASEVCP